MDEFKYLWDIIEELDPKVLRRKDRYYKERQYRDLLWKYWNGKPGSIKDREIFDKILDILFETLKKRMTDELGPDRIIRIKPASIEIRFDKRRAAYKYGFHLKIAEELRLAAKQNPSFRSSFLDKYCENIKKACYFNKLLTNHIKYRKSVNNYTYELKKKLIHYIRYSVSPFPSEVFSEIERCGIQKEKQFFKY